MTAGDEQGSHESVSLASREAKGMSINGIGPSKQMEKGDMEEKSKLKSLTAFSRIVQAAATLMTGVFLAHDSYFQAAGMGCVATAAYLGEYGCKLAADLYAASVKAETISPENSDDQLPKAITARRHI
jgi:hypothetical protein